MISGKGVTHYFVDRTCTKRPRVDFPGQPDEGKVGPGRREEPASRGL